MKLIVGIVIGVVIAAVLIWFVLQLTGECGQAIRAFGGGFMDVLGECL